MKIVFTADLHLTTKKEHPERFNALKEILNHLVRENISLLVIAGDLFDQSQKNFSEFEKLIGQPEYKPLRIIVIPGNHDLVLSSSMMVEKNIQVINAPTKIALEKDKDFFFLPYMKEKNMGEVIGEYAAELTANKWILIAHGDWTGGLKTASVYEEGVYMPLTKKDIEIFKPCRVFLGHVHVPSKPGIVTYTGSPCGIDITETGIRSFLVYDTSNDELSSVPLVTDVIFCNETFIILPVANESEYAAKKIDQRISSWAIEKELRNRIALRVKVFGYCNNRNTLAKVFSEKFSGFSFYKSEGPDLTEVRVSDEYAKSNIAELVMNKLNSFEEIPTEEGFPTHDQILQEALATIYGV